jgi:hypothetical protein
MHDHLGTTYVRNALATAVAYGLSAYWQLWRAETSLCNIDSSYNNSDCERTVTNARSPRWCTG